MIHHVLTVDQHLAKPVAFFGTVSTFGMVHPIGLWNLENDRNMWEISDNIEFQVDISMMISSSWSFFTDFMEFFLGARGCYPLTINNWSCGNPPKTGSVLMGKSSMENGPASHWLPLWYYYYSQYMESHKNPWFQTTKQTTKLCWNDWSNLCVTACDLPTLGGPILYKAPIDLAMRYEEATVSSWTLLV